MLEKAAPRRRVAQPQGRFLQEQTLKKKSRAVFFHRPACTNADLMQGQRHGMYFPLAECKHGAGNLLLFIPVHHPQGLGFTKERKPSSFPLLLSVVEGGNDCSSLSGAITQWQPSPAPSPPASSSQAGASAKLAVQNFLFHSEKPHDFRVFNTSCGFFSPLILLLLLQALNCLRSSSSKEIFVSYWT